VPATAPDCIPSKVSEVIWPISVGIDVILLRASLRVCKLTRSMIWVGKLGPRPTLGSASVVNDEGKETVFGIVPLVKVLPPNFRVSSLLRSPISSGKEPDQAVSLLTKLMTSPLPSHSISNALHSSTTHNAHSHSSSCKSYISPASR